MAKAYKGLSLSEHLRFQLAHQHECLIPADGLRASCGNLMSHDLGYAEGRREPFDAFLARVGAQFDLVMTRAAHSAQIPVHSVHSAPLRSLLTVRACRS